MPTATTSSAPRFYSGVDPQAPHNQHPLPYRLCYGHWGMSAWIGGGWGNPGERIAEVFFPVGSRGPFDPPGAQREALKAKLHADALAAIAVEG